ncbi:HET-domain-containing protein [Cucurbitaria berberidis CBS 394.84]|uniref:HET-domain-containing protein n=1 Tax=Cucurbitaria berberidis CBS 394.84 TaxID=1168544 RepID=A0A9P4GC08_9PLEO|nr:HET-domain-containing protein [Cucurbitaria berberidis CBS 394.84]KAF1843088.1 HET-domain-containing protein [Cucurbitaria berberidis CBS 394.84]
MAVCERCAAIYLDDGCFYALSNIGRMVLSACPGCHFFLKVVQSYGNSIEEIAPETQVFLLRPELEENLVQGLFFTMKDSSFTIQYKFNLRMCLETPFWIDYEHENTKYLGRLISEHSGGDECLDLAKAWFERCTKSHGAACSLEKAVAFPTRLIYIPRDDPSRLKLCVTQGMRGQYVTLSYCWGKGNFFKTLSTNMEELQSSFEAETLPETLRDAVRLTHRMGFEWLWIDSLCILQDDFPDWSRESSRMAQIYGNAAFTICADSTRSTDDGIFRQRDVLQSHQFGRDSAFRLQALCKPWGNMPQHPLYSRGWAFQERMLSSRNLHFLNGQIAWECNTTLYMEEFRARINHPAVHFTKNLFTKYFHQQRLPAGTEPAEGASIPRIAAWNSIVQEMAVRMFTFDSDRLAAISGMASALQIPDMGTYFAGVWSRNPFLSMAWFMRFPQSVPKSYKGPSWSWVWTQRQIVWHDDTWCEDELFKSEANADWKSWDEAFGPRLLEQKMIYKGVDPKGEVLEGSHLVMTGYCRPIYVAEIPDTDSDDNFQAVAGSVKLQNERGSRVCMDVKRNNWNSVSSFIKDFSDAEAEIDAKSVKEYLCVQIVRELKRRDWNPKILALVLEEVDDANGQAFRRVGLLDLDADASEEQWEKRTLKLV